MKEEQKSQEDKKPLISDGMKETLKEPFTMPIWGFAILIAAVILFAVASIAQSLQLSDVQQQLDYQEDKEYAQKAYEVTSKGLNYTWEWFASNTLMFIWRYLGLILGALWVVLLIHGFKVIGR